MNLKTIPSPDGLYIAAVTDNRLDIRRSRAIRADPTTRSIPINTHFASGITFIRWSNNRISPHASERPTPHRILLADSLTICVWDVVDTQWHAKIDNARGTFGKIAQVDFGINEDHILVFSEFGVKISVWSLDTGKCKEIRDPKFSHARGFAFRPRTGHLALLTRPNAFDNLTIHSPGTLEAINSFVVPTTDAQGLKWSPDGQWIAVWDSVSSGSKVLIYTPDGQLYRTYSRDVDDEMSGLGIRCLEWAPASNYLAVSSYDNSAILLNTKTFSPVVTFNHASSISERFAVIWHEQVSVSDGHSYVSLPKPVYPLQASTQSTDPNLKFGVSTITFNASGTLMATRIDSMATSVWIWSVQSLNLVSVVIQHSPLRNISWHPSSTGLLLLTCASDTALAYQWNLEWDMPRIAPIPIAGSKVAIQWLPSEEEEHPLLLASTNATYSVGFIAHDEKRARSQFVDIWTSEDRNHSTSEAMQRTRDITDLFDESMMSESDSHLGAGNRTFCDMDDTFYYRKYSALPPKAD